MDIENIDKKNQHNESLRTERTKWHDKHLVVKHVQKAYEILHSQFSLSYSMTAGCGHWPESKINLQQHLY